MKSLLRCAIVVWAAPATALGLMLAIAALASGGNARRRGFVVEVHGGLARRFLETFPGEPIAMTLGHSVIGRTQAALDITRAHELVHVRQYERWGPLIDSSLSQLLALAVAKPSRSLPR